MQKRLYLFLLFVLCSASAFANEPIRIWDGMDKSLRKVTLKPFLPEEGERRAAIIICPGGSYHWLDAETEGDMVARWLKEQGIAAFVLRYRTAGVAAFVTYYRSFVRGRQHPDMLQDIQRAIQLVRENADEYGINASRIGVMGFSVGGHLVMSSALFFQTNFLAPLNIFPKVSLRPDFVASIYPVVTLSDKQYTHKRSRRGLLGERDKSNPVMQDSLSLEKHISPDCPPTFLMACKDDPIVKYQNSVLLDSALTAHNVPHKYVQYETGGHGFGADDSQGSEESSAWKTEFLDWLKTLF